MDFAQKEVDIVFGIRIFAVDLLFIASVEQGQILQLPPGIGPRLCFRGHGRKFLPAAVVLLQLGNKVVHRFDERIAFFQTAVDLQLLPVFPGNARQDHMAAVLVDEGLPAAAQFAEQPVSQTGHGQHFHIHETLHLQVAECLLLRLQGILVRHQQNGPHRLRLRSVSRIQSAGPLLPNHVEYEFFLIQAFAAVVYVQHVLSLIISFSAVGFLQSFHQFHQLRRRLHMKVDHRIVNQRCIVTGDSPVHHHRTNAGIVGTLDIKRTVSDHD